MRAFLALLLALLATSGSGCFLLQPREALPEAELAEEARDSAELALEALAAGDDETAHATLLRMRAFHQDPGTQAWIDSVMEIVEGRRLVAALDMELAVVQDEAAGAVRRRLVLRVRSSADAPVVLEMTPPGLRCRRAWIDAKGNGGHTEEVAALDVLARLEIPAGVTTELPVMDLDGARGQACAVRESWDLEMHFCSLKSGERTFPINAPPVRGVERYMLASHLNLGALDAGPLVESLRAPEAVPIEQLVERGVRIPPVAMVAALDALGPVVAELPLQRIERAAPVLTWIAESSGEAYHDPGNPLALAIERDLQVALVEGGTLLAPRHLRGDPRAWKAWFQTRVALEELKSRSSLDLPGAMGHSLGQ